MKKYFLRSMALICCLLLQHAGVFAQAVVCPTVTPTGVPTAPGSSTVHLPCGVTCATLSATAGPSLTATNTYSVSPITYAPFSYTTGTVPTSNYLGFGTLTSKDDAYSSKIALPFRFCFFGNTYDSVVIGVNGNISFNYSGATSVADAFDPWSMSGGLPGAGGSAIYNGVLSPWNDIYPQGGGTILYQTYGTAPCRQFVVSYNAVKLYSGSCPDVTTSQIVLYEASNIIDVNIGHRAPCSSWNSGLAITAIQNATGSVFYAPPGENGTTFTANNEAWRFTPTGAAGSWTYSWAGPGGAAGTGATVTVCPSVTSTYTVTATSTACIGVTVNALIPVEVETVTPVTGVNSICMGSTTTLFNATAGGSWASGNPGVATVDASGLVTSVSAGTAVITYTMPPPGGGAAPCFATTIVTVQPTPIISGTFAVCLGGSETLSGLPSGGTWVSGNASIATITSTGGVVTGAGLGSAPITYTSPAGCAGYATVSVFSPTAITGIPKVCMGSTTTLGNATTGGTWVSDNTSIATVGLANGVVTGVLAGTANITYTTPGGCTKFQIVTVDPTSPILGTPEVCQYLTKTFTDTLSGGTWSSGSPAIATIGSASGLLSGLTPGTVTITYTIGATGCMMQQVVTVHPKPAPPTITSPTSFCQFEIAVPLAAAASGTLKWYGTGVTPPMLIAPTPVTNVPGVDTYYVTQTSVFGCVSDSTLAPVTIKPKPDAPITRDTTYCQYFDHAAPLTAVGSNLKWYTAGSTLLGSAPVPPTSFVGSTTWYVSQTVDGCASDKAPLTVTIVFKPDFTIAASALKVCQFDTLVLSYNGPMMPGPGYHWDLPIGASIVRGSAYDSVITVEFDTAWGPHPVYLTASNLNGLCSTTKVLNINVIAEPFAHSFIKRDICLGDTILLALSSRSDNASEFTWLIDGTPLATSTNVNVITADWHTGGPFLVSFNTPGNHIIKIQATVDGMCPSKIEPDTLRVHDLPNSKFKTLNSYSPLCLEDSIEFQADTIGYNYSYTWAPDHSFHNTNKGHIWGRLESERTIIKLTVTDPFGCKSTSSMEFLPETCCTVFVPNAFTPNGDGHDDTYYARFKGDSYHRVHIFRITNRWGQTLFQSTDSDPRWDGTYNGVPQDMGVYFYYIKYDCGGKTMETKGDCTLVR